MSSTNEEILHYQRKILKYGSDSKVLLHCLNKLTKLPIGVEHLQATGIGRTINGMRKADGAVGEEARSLVNKWKEMVAAEDKSDSDQQEEDASHHQLETTSDNSSTSPTHRKKDKDSKKKDSIKDKCKEESVSTSKSKSSSSKEKSPEKHASKSSKGSEKRKDVKDGESSKSKSSRKRRHSQEDSNSTADEEDGDEAPTQSFADALGSIKTISKKKKSKDKEKHSGEKKREEKKFSFLPSPAPESSVISKPVLPPPKSFDILRPADLEISPHYKPLPLKFSADPLPSMKDKAKSSEEALTTALSFSQKGNRTKVFSGNRSSGLAFVPTLFDSCIRFLQSNVDSLDYLGVPYELIRPVLERANSHQLYLLEHHNPYLLEDTDELWKVLCQKEYRKAVREEMETWRDLYLRCHEEREARLKSLTSSHKQSMAKATPQRTTKLAYVESVAKAPRGVGKPGQVKQGASAVLASMTNAKSGARPFEASANHAGNGSTAVAEVVKMGGSAPRSSSSSTASAAKKPKVAPLMQKTLKALKNRYRR
uniref:EOG090X0BTZ n=1 Tax=Daphnia pulicaria TaxID=35523 RepID=A0A4Y7MYK6_9CRUS|nr:EOG090X0BTZ [Daphnia pulicaria]